MIALSVWRNSRDRILPIVYGRLDTLSGQLNAQSDQLNTHSSQLDGLSGQLGGLSGQLNRLSGIEVDTPFDQLLSEIRSLKRD